MNSRGFTLVETLVTLAIIGIISGLAFPAILKVRTSNQETKYEVYGESLISGAKLYVDKYKVDLDGGNYCVSYNTLLDGGFIKEYKGQGETISDPDSVYVYFYKNGNSVTKYQLSLVLSNGYDSKKKHKFSGTCDKVI